MRHTVIVINGKGGVGKDTLCDMASKHYKVRNVSSITPIKEIARMCGWGGEKDERARKFLSDLKALTTNFNDYPTSWLISQYRDFLCSDDEIMFVHIREGEEIKKFSDAVGGDVKTLLIRGGERLKGVFYGNASDDDVEKYNYDFYFTNDKPLPETEEAFCRLLQTITGSGKTEK